MELQKSFRRSLRRQEWSRACGVRHNLSFSSRSRGVFQAARTGPSFVAAQTSDGASLRLGALPLELRAAPTMSEKNVLTYGKEWEEKLDAIVTILIGEEGKYQAIKSFVRYFLLTYFKDIIERGSHRVPKTGPVFLVCAPHANQFIDPAIVVSTCPRKVGYLTAKVSLENVAAVKVLGKAMQAIPVPRPQDYASKGIGLVYTTDEGGKVQTLKGIGTQFMQQVHPRDQIVFPSKEQLDVLEVKSDTELVVKGELTAPVLATLALSAQAAEEVKSGTVPDSVTAPPAPPAPKPQTKQSTLNKLAYRLFGIGAASRQPKAPSPPQAAGYGSTFRVIPHLDQNAVYSAVHERLGNGGAVGIFPEGGSHDQPELLPLKAGVIVMALGAMVQQPDLDVKLVPVGLHYFNRDRFRSRVAVEYGAPVSIPPEYVEMYKQGGEAKRKAIGELLERTFAALKSVTVNAPDYDTLKVVQTARRLLRPINRQLTEHENLELTRRLMTSYLKYKDNEEHKAMMDRLLAFHHKLETYNIRDHQLVDFSIGVGGFETVRILITRVAQLLTMLVVALPGSFLLLPPMFLIRRYAQEKARKAKAASTVKLTGQDVISTNKIIFGSIVVPVYFFAVTCAFTSALVFFFGWPWITFLFFPVFYGGTFFVAWMTIRLSEIGSELRNSLWPLFMSLLNPSVTDDLRKERAALQHDLNEMVEKFAPSIIENYGENRILDPSEMDYNEYVSRSLANRKKPNKAFTEWERDRKRTPTAVSVNASDADMFAAGSALDFSAAADEVHLLDARSDDDDDIEEAEDANWRQFLSTI
ncbi:hypothetical protein DFJ74DRAFT_308101 [Hyaloraphidium curvatum]|nr:hypothetical protein DFJ74DRAFT_308101 [Hyaloraphidium curvatum]